MKAALSKFTQLTAADGVKNTGVRCNAIAPGVINTGMTEDIYFNEGAPMAMLAPAVSNVSPIGGLINVEDVAGTVAFLASDEGNVSSNYIRVWNFSKLFIKLCT